MRAPLLVVLLMLLAGCAEAPVDDAPTPAAPTPTPEPSPMVATPPPTDNAPTSSPIPMPGPNEVYIWGFSFVNETTTVMAGSTVTWTNMNPLTHTITADDGSFDSGPVRAEYGFSHTFGTPGEYRYHCEIHASMKGSIVVLGDEVVVLTPPSSQPTPETPTPEPTPATPTPAPTPAPTPTPTPTPTPPPAPTQVNIQNFAFSPNPLAIPVGTTVRWTNLDGAPHTATANGGAFNTGTLQQGASAEHTFQAAGSFSYFCAIHTSMTATVTVG